MEYEPQACPVCGGFMITESDVLRHFREHLVGIMALTQSTRPPKPKPEPELGYTPAGILVTDRIGGGMRVDPYQAVYASSDEALRGFVQERLTRNLIAYGEDFGFMISADACWFEWDRVVGGSDEGALCCWVEWSPDPMRGVELRGGPADGTEVALPREHRGRPTPRWTIASLNTPDIFRSLDLPNEAPIPDLSVQTFDYDRAGIDSVRNVWVYQCRR